MSNYHNFTDSALKLLDTDRSKLIRLLKKFKLWNLFIFSSIDPSSIVELKTFLTNIKNLITPELIPYLNTATIEITNTLLFTKRQIISLQHPSQYSSLKRLISDYSYTINKLKNTLADYNKSLEKESSKKIISTKDLQKEIQKLYAEYSKNIKDTEYALQLATTDANNYLSTDTTNKKFDTLTEKWYQTKLQIEHLEAELHNLKKILNIG
mgnify:CR=1 FL=1